MSQVSKAKPILEADCENAWLISQQSKVLTALVVPVEQLQCIPSKECPTRIPQARGGFAVSSYGCGWEEMRRFRCRWHSLQKKNDMVYSPNWTPTPELWDLVSILPFLLLILEGWTLENECGWSSNSTWFSNNTKNSGVLSRFRFLLYAPHIHRKKKL